MKDIQYFPESLWSKLLKKKGGMGWSIASNLSLQVLVLRSASFCKKFEG